MLSDLKLEAGLERSISGVCEAEICGEGNLAGVEYWWSKT